MTDRERLIARNLEAQARVLEIIAAKTGIRLQHLQLISELKGKDWSGVLALADEAFATENIAFVRKCFYQMFARGVTAEYVPRLLSWHAAENDGECLRHLDFALAKSPTSLHSQIAAYLASVPEKAGFDGIVFLCRAVKADSSLLATLRQHFDQRRYDLESLAEVANVHEPEYNLVAQAPPHGTGRLTGSQCVSVMRHQLPRQEYHFRRADLIPYYGRVVERIGASPSLKDQVDGLVERYMPDVERPAIVSIPRVTPVAVPLIVDVQRAGVKAIVLLRQERESSKSGHRKRSVLEAPLNDRYCELAVLEVEPAQSWNLLPKQLLPPDHPIRFAVPED